MLQVFLNHRLLFLDLHSEKVIPNEIFAIDDHMVQESKSNTQAMNSAITQLYAAETARHAMHCEQQMFNLLQRFEEHAQNFERLQEYERVIQLQARFIEQLTNPPRYEESAPLAPNSNPPLALNAYVVTPSAPPISEDISNAAESTSAPASSHRHHFLPKMKWFRRK
jgi:hypothetical protein